MKKTIKAIDAFGFFAGVVGLVADAIGLGGLVVASNVEQGGRFFLWAFLFLSTIYSVSLINFFFRNRLYSSCSDQLEALNETLNQHPPQGLIAEDALIRRKSLAAKNSLIRRIDMGTMSAACLIGIPIIICFVCAAFYVDSANNRLDRVFIGLPGLILANRMEYTLYGVLYGSFLGYCLCWTVNWLVLQIFTALEPAYDS